MPHRPARQLSRTSIPDPPLPCAGQVSSSGDVQVVSGFGAKGTSYMTLSGGKGLGPYEAQQLADLLQKDPPSLLASLTLRRMHFSLACPQKYLFLPSCH